MPRHAGVSGFLAVFDPRVRGDGDDGQIDQTDLLANDARGRVAVHDRHLNVHQHGVETRFGRAQPLDSGESVACNHHLGPGAREHQLDHVLVELIVFGHEQTQAREAPVGFLWRGQHRRVVAGIGPTHRFQQARGHDRLGHDTVEVEVVAGGASRTQLEGRRHQHHQRQADIGRGIGLSQHLEAIHARHAPVEQHEVVIAPVGCTAAQLSQARHARLDRRGAPAKIGAGLLQDAARQRVVVNNEKVQAREAGVPRWRGRLRSGAQRHGKAKFAALPQGGLNRDPAPHQLGKLAADGQPQAGAAVLARHRGIDLRKHAKNGVELLARDANTRIAHRKLQRHAFGFARETAHRDHDFAGLRELDGIADEVEQYLLQAQGVTHQRIG